MKLKKEFMKADDANTEINPAQSNIAATKSLLAVQYVTPELVAIPIIGKGKSGPPVVPLRELQLSAPSGIVECIYFRHDHSFEMIEPAGKDAETFAAIAYACANSLMAAEQNQCSFEVPGRVSKLLCGARYRGGVPAFLEPMTLLPSGNNEVTANKDLPLWQHFKLNHARRNRITFVACPLGGEPLQLSLTYAANASWKNGRLWCPPKPAGDIQEVLDCLWKYLVDPSRGFNAHRAGFRNRQRKLDAQKRCRDRREKAKGDRSRKNSD